MENINLKKTFGDGPNPFPMESLKEIFDIYGNDTTLLIDPKPFAKFDLYPGSHYHSDYEFLITYLPLEHAGVDCKEINLKPKEILLIHSEEPHGPMDVMKEVRFLGLSVEKEFLKEIWDSLFGPKEVCFPRQTLGLTFQLESLIRRFMQESIVKQTGYEMILKCLSIEIVIDILRKAVLLNKGTNKPGQFIDPNIKHAIDMLQDCYNQDYTLEQLAKAVNLSPYHFIRVFKTQTGQTPFSFLLDIKLDRACQMLRENKLSITEICYSSGFKSTSHFATVFKKKYGVSPSEYRNQI